MKGRGGKLETLQRSTRAAAGLGRSTRMPGFIWLAGMVAAPARPPCANYYRHESCSCTRSPP